MNVQPFVLLGSTYLLALQESLHRDLVPWTSTWFAGEVSTRIEVRPEKQFNGEDGDFRGFAVENTARERLAMCSMNAEAVEQLGSLLFGGESSNFRSLSDCSLFNSLVHTSLHDLILRILHPEDSAKIICMDQETIEKYMSADAFSPGREMLRLIIDVDRISFSLWLPLIPLLPRFFSPSVSAGCGEGEILRFKEALANQRLTARVELGEAELTLGALANLKIGDVIRLDKTLEEPLTLGFEESSVKFSGFLGQQNSLFAFQIDEMLT